MQAVFRNINLITTISVKHYNRILRTYIVEKWTETSVLLTKGIAGKR